MLVITQQDIPELIVDFIFLHRLSCPHNLCVPTSKNLRGDNPAQNNPACHWPLYHGSQHHLHMKKHNHRQKSVPKKILDILIPQIYGFALK